MIGNNAAGEMTLSLAVDDINRDGKRDLVTANYISEDVSVLLGNGDGSFQTQLRFSVGFPPISAELVDLNGDDVLDLAVTSFRDVYHDANVFVLVLFGKGDGSFQAQQSYLVGDSLSDVGFSDFNSDGKLDLVVANYTVMVSLNNGDGSFHSLQQFSTGSTPISLTLNELNGDGKLDLVVTRRAIVDGASEVLVMINSGDGRFRQQQRFGVSERSGPAQLGDLNGDGLQDMVVGNFSVISVLLGDVDGNFNKLQDIAGNVRALADVNGDGILDIVGKDVSVMLGNGDGSFQLLQRFNAGNAASFQVHGDLNGDGKIDFAVNNYGEAPFTDTFITVVIANSH